MLRRFKVIADYPHSKFQIGEVLIQRFYEGTRERIYIYVTNLESPLQGNVMGVRYVENMPHIFQEIDPIPMP